MYMAIQNVLFLCTTDNVTDSDGVSHTAFIHDGVALPHAILHLAGRDLAEKLTKILTERGFPFTAAAEREIVWDVTEKRFYIGFDHDAVFKPTAEIDKDKTYVLPDVNNTTVCAARLRCAEVFQPSLTGKEASGFDISSWTKCDVDIRKELIVRQCRVRLHGHVPRDQ